MRRLSILLFAVIALLAPSLPTIPAAAQLANTCLAQIQEWRDNYIPITDEGAAIASGCRKDENGNWFLPLLPDDDRFPGGPILSAEEVELIDPIDRELLGMIDGMTQAMPSWMPAELERIYSPIKRPLYGRRQPGMQYGSLADQYEKFLISYISIPSNDLLYGYVGWWVQRLMSVLPDYACMQAGAPDAICNSWRISLGFLAPPWPWDLADPINRAEFFRWVIDQGLI